MTGILGRHKTCPYIWSIPVGATLVVAHLYSFFLICEDSR